MPGWRGAIVPFSDASGKFDGVEDFLTSGYGTRDSSLITYIMRLQEEIKASKDEWEDAKNNKEKIEIANARRWAVFYLDACV